MQKNSDTISKGAAIAIISVTIIIGLATVGGLMFFLFFNTGSSNSSVQPVANVSNPIPNIPIGDSSQNQNVPMLSENIDISSHIFRFNLILDAMSINNAMRIQQGLPPLDGFNLSRWATLRIETELDIVENSNMPQFMYTWDNEEIHATMQMLINEDNDITLIRIGGTIDPQDGVYSMLDISMAAIAMIDPIEHTLEDLMATLFNIPMNGETVNINGIEYQFQLGADDFVFVALRDTRTIREAGIVVPTPQPTPVTTPIPTYTPQPTPITTPTPTNTPRPTATPIPTQQINSELFILSEFDARIDTNNTLGYSQVRYSFLVTRGEETPRSNVNINFRVYNAEGFLIINATQRRLGREDTYSRISRSNILDGIPVNGRILLSGTGIEETSFWFTFDGERAFLD